MAGLPARWGWHQLDDGWARRLVNQARIRPGDLVLDVGAGTGAISRPLVAAGARVIAIELHPARAVRLRAQFDRRDVKVVVADAADLRLPRQPFRVVANPPFGITTALLRRLLSPKSQLVRADLVLPRWAAVRWAEGRGAGGVPGKHGFVAIVTLRVPRSAFHPPPRDDAAVLAIERS